MMVVGHAGRFDGTAGLRACAMCRRYTKVESSVGVLTFYCRMLILLALHRLKKNTHQR